jgi:hypothetical protein
VNAKAAGQPPPEEPEPEISHIHRMHPAPGSGLLASFKSDLAKHGRYFLMGASISPSGTNPVLNRQTAIEKKLIVFKDVSQITGDDDDVVIFAREDTRRPH